MRYEVIVTKPFQRNYKKLSKKYRSLKSDLLPVIEELEKNPTLGISLGKGCYKIRVAISSKGKGKSGGARLITYIRVVEGKVFLLDIYDKSSKASLTTSELKRLLKLISDS